MNSDDRTAMGELGEASRMPVARPVLPDNGAVTATKSKGPEYEPLKSAEYEPLKSEPDLEQLDVHRQTYKSGTRASALKKSSLRSDNDVVFQSKGPVAEFVNGDRFRTMVGLLVCLNLIHVGLEADYGARYIDANTPFAYDTIDKLFSVCFVVEISFRLYVFKRHFFTEGGNWRWNVFDFSLVIFQVIHFGSEPFLSYQRRQSVTRMCRFVRLLRILRLIRFFSMVEDLRVIVMTIEDSFKLFISTMVLLMGVLYFFGVLFTELSTRYRRLLGLNKHDPELSNNLRHHYGSLFFSILTLFESIAGGISWDEAIRPTIRASSVWGLAYCLFVAFCTYAVLNIITSIFVNSSMQYAEQVRKDKILTDMMRDMTSALDVDGDGTVDRAEFVECLETVEMQEYFMKFNLYVTYAQHLFTVLDTSRDGTVEVTEFINAMAQLARPAQALETTLILQEVFYISDLVRSLSSSKKH